MSRYRSSDAILLKAVSYGEGHRIFTCFGREEGKYAAVARGVLKQKSKLKGHLQLGNRCELELVEGKGLATISSAKAVEVFAANREKADRYFYMSYFLELLNDFTVEGSPDEEMFTLINGVLKALERVEPALLARFYELKLLDVCGYGLALEHCAVCGKKLNGGFFDPRRCQLLCKDCGGGTAVSPKAHFVLKYLNGCEWQHVSRLKTDPETLREVAAVNKGMIEAHLEKSVRSLEILKKFEAGFS